MQIAKPIDEMHVHRERTRRLVLASLSAVCGKGVVLLSTAVSIPITVRYLGPEWFGVWITISSSTALLLVFDLGVVNALTNRISEAFAKEDKDLASRYATSAYAMICLIALTLGIIGGFALTWAPWGKLFHTQTIEKISLISHSTGLAFALFVIGLPATTASKLLGGYQELQIANLFAGCGSLMSLAGIALVVRLHGSLVFLIWASVGSIVLTNYWCLMWIWFRHMPWLRPSRHHWDRKMAAKLMSSGTDLFVLQVAGLIVFNSDNFVISSYLGPAEVVPYAVTWRLVGYAAALQIIISPALWPTYAEAYVRGDIRWIRSALARVMASTMGVASIACVTLMLFGRSLIRIWAGPAAVPSFALLLAMCIWILISTFMANTSTVLLATNQTRMQTWLSVLAAGVNLGLSVCLVRRIGSLGVILATIASYVIVLVGPQTWKVYTVLHSEPGDQAAQLVQL